MFAKSQAMNGSWIWLTISSYALDALIFTFYFFKSKKYWLFKDYFLKSYFKFLRISESREKFIVWRDLFEIYVEYFSWKIFKLIHVK